MRVCPNCGYVDPLYWKKAHFNNPQGDVEVARIDELELHEPHIAELVKDHEAHVRCPFAYYLAPQAIWVKRIWAKLYEDGGLSAFNIPHDWTHRRKAKREGRRT